MLLLEYMKYHMSSSVNRWQIMKLPVIICVIGNPKYRFRNSGIRGYITIYL